LNALCDPILASVNPFTARDGVLSAAMAATAVKNRSTINLKGSAATVKEYFNFAVNK
jgi:hypothetical protein